MTSLAAIPYEQVVTPVDPTVAPPTMWNDPVHAAAPQATYASTPTIASPAATSATAWLPQEVSVPTTSTGDASLMDAIAGAIVGAAPAAPAPISSLTPGAAPATTVAPSALAAGAAAAPSANPLANPLATPAAAAVGSAVAGFAAATGRAVTSAVGTAVGVAGAGISGARKVGTELWAGVRNPRAIHVSQVPSKYNPAPAANNRDCGPTSVVMALRLLGRKIPGVTEKAAPQKMIDQVRKLSGNVQNTASTTNHELERALTAAGTKVRELSDFASIRESVFAGKPIILNGNPRAAGSYGPKFTAAQMTPYNGAHWIVVSGYDSKRDEFIINDPLSKVGPVKVTPAQLEAYRGGSMGIEVAA